jgi:dTDP-4-amino-4,6-dideoxygalactose transaminase
VRRKPIYVTQPTLPPLEEFVPLLEQIWGRRILTNGGPFHQELEAALQRHLGVPQISLFSNGTIALISALQALEIRDEVITTPYSFVATAHAILWNRLKPVFVDIEPDFLNIDPARIEAAITPATTAILAVHCYGNPCKMAEIEEIAKRHSLRVIYDAAHAFGVEESGRSVLNGGDLSVLSLHATKVFNTFEGGAIVCNSEAMKSHIDNLKNFGFVDEVTVVEAGINGKLNEVSAALGLLQLQRVDEYIARRKQIAEIYTGRFKQVPGVRAIEPAPNVKSNYSYYPILVGKGYPLTRDQLFQRLRENSIFARRYFYPLITSFPMYRSLPSANPAALPVASGVAEEVICLPIYPDLELHVVEEIADLICTIGRNG